MTETEPWRICFQMVSVWPEKQASESHQNRDWPCSWRQEEEDHRQEPRLTVFPKRTGQEAQSLGSRPLGCEGTSSDHGSQGSTTQHRE